MIALGSPWENNKGSVQLYKLRDNGSGPDWDPIGNAISGESRNEYSIKLLLTKIVADLWLDLATMEIMSGF